MIGSINKKINSVEANLLLSHRYDKFYGMSNNSVVDDVFGPTLFRPEKYIETTDRLNNLLDIYTRDRINKLYSLSLREFLSLTKVEINILLHHARKTLETQSNEIDELMGEEE